jgi:hypothetical protein
VAHLFPQAPAGASDLHRSSPQHQLSADNTAALASRLVNADSPLVDRGLIKRTLLSARVPSSESSHFPRGSNSRVGTRQFSLSIEFANRSERLLASITSPPRRRPHPTGRDGKLRPMLLGKGRWACAPFSARSASRTCTARARGMRG